MCMPSGVQLTDAFIIWKLVVIMRRNMVFGVNVSFDQNKVFNTDYCYETDSIRPWSGWCFGQECRICTDVKQKTTPIHAERWSYIWILWSCARISGYRQATYTTQHHVNHKHVKICKKDNTIFCVSHPLHTMKNHMSWKKNSLSTKMKK